MCKHPKKEVFSRWITANGFSISFQAGVDKIKKEYTCLICGKLVKKPQ